MVEPTKQRCFGSFQGPEGRKRHTRSRFWDRDSPPDLFFSNRCQGQCIKRLVLGPLCIPGRSGLLSRPSSTAPNRGLRLTARILGARPHKGASFGRRHRGRLSGCCQKAAPLPFKGRFPTGHGWCVGQPYGKPKGSGAAFSAHQEGDNRLADAHTRF